MTLLLFQLIDWWNEVAYLRFRESVVVNSNPAVGFPQQVHGDRETFAKYSCFHKYVNHSAFMLSLHF